MNPDPLPPAPCRLTLGTVLSACKRAAEAEQTANTLRLIAGVMLIEYRAQLMANTEVSWNHPTKQHGFESWLSDVGIPKPTAYRWMKAAENILRPRLGLPGSHDFSPVIDVGGTAVPISLALTAPEAELSPEALTFRQDLFTFMEDKTLAEAVRASLDGESDPSRISRAANGKLHGGATDLAHDPDARKQFPLFAARALSETLTHIGARVGKQGGHWHSMTPQQRHETEGYLALFVSGLDDQALAFISESAREETLARKKGKRPEPLALRSALTRRP